MNWLICSIAFLIAVTADEKPHGYGNRPRGVPLLKAALYEEKEEFECLDGSKKIPFDQVNDDYCDCVDGSDEPGTSACPNGKFHCLNIGYKPLDIYSSRVNDYICDCCDGSDEWDSGVQCPNVCSELGKKAREDAQKHRVVVESGFAKRSELAKKGAQQIQEMKSGLELLKKQLEEIQPSKDAADKKKNEAEEKEKAAKDKHDQAWNEILDQKRKKEGEELFEKLDVDKDKKLTISDLKAHTELDKDDNGEVSDDEAKDFLGGGDELEFEGFMEKSFIDIKNRLKQKTKKEAEEKKETKPEGEGEDADEFDEEVLDSTPDEAEDEQKPPYDDETKKLIEEADEARKQFQEVLSKYSEVENNVRDAERFLEFDYGTDHAWAPLKGQCIELDESQYTYKLCLFEKAIQKERNGHSEISLGNWKEWTGPENDKYSTQKYDGGQHCWNGPARSTEVLIECGDETKLIETSEPSKCEYQFRLQSPAACIDPAKLDENAHIEL